MQKRLETINGSFISYDRDYLARASRTELRCYLESRGFAVYSSEPTALLRETALEDFDGEKAR